MIDAGLCMGCHRNTPSVMRVIRGSIISSMIGAYKEECVTDIYSTIAHHGV